MTESLEVAKWFAEPNDGIVLGALAMEGMEWKVDPKNGRIVTEDVFLAHWVPKAPNQLKRNRPLGDSRLVRCEYRKRITCSG